MTDSCSAPVLGFVAASGTGKTNLLTRLVPALAGDDALYSVPAHVSVLALNQPDQVADFIVYWLHTVERHTHEPRQQ